MTKVCKTCYYEALRQGMSSERAEGIALNCTHRTEEANTQIFVNK